MGFKGISSLHAVNRFCHTQFQQPHWDRRITSRRDVYNLPIGFHVKCVLCGFENGSISVSVFHNTSTVLYEKNLQVVIESSRCHKCHPLLPVREDADVLSHHWYTVCACWVLETLMERNANKAGGLEGGRWFLSAPKSAPTSSQGPSGDGKNHIQDDPAGQPGEIHTHLSC